MSRIKLKCGGRPKRKKALFGEAIVAAATLGAAAMNVAATNAASKQQAKAIEDNANLQGEIMKQQNETIANVNKENQQLTIQQNKENRQLFNDFQTSLQLQAGRQNMNARMENNKQQVKFGGRPNRRKLKSPSFYGGDDMPFTVTDGGGVIPLDTDSQGYGLYELYGNDHEHYHKTSGGKHKTGVGIKFANGEVIEGEGNQNSNQGELMYVTPNDAMFISKHSIAGFNPTKAVQAGMQPEEAFAYQEAIKDANGYNDDGTMAKCGGRKKLKAMIGMNVPLDNGNFPIIINPANVAGGVISQTNSPVAKCGKRVSLRRKANLGSYFGNFNNWGGAAISGGANLIGSGLTAWGNIAGGKRIANAWNNAANVLADYASQMHGIDISDAGITRDNYDTGTAIAAIRDANIRYNAQRNRLDRNLQAERRAIDKNTLSSAARNNRLASTDDRAALRYNEIAEAEHNANEQIRQGNMERITNVSQANANLKMQAAQHYNDALMRAKMFNAEVDNMKLGIIGQAKADALTQGASARAIGLQTGLNSIGAGIGAVGNAFASSYDAYNTYNRNIDLALMGADSIDKADYLVMNANDPANRARAKQLYDSWKNGSTKQQEYAARLKKAYNFVDALDSASIYSI